MADHINHLIEEDVQRQRRARVLNDWVAQGVVLPAGNVMGHPRYRCGKFDFVDVMPPKNHALPSEKLIAELTLCIAAGNDCNTTFPLETEEAELKRQPLYKHEPLGWMS